MEGLASGGIDLTTPGFPTQWPVGIFDDELLWKVDYPAVLNYVIGRNSGLLSEGRYQT